MVSCSRAARRGATLAELLVVIGIVSVLLGMLMPATQMAWRAAERLLEQNDEYQDRLELAMADDALATTRPAGTAASAVSTPFARTARPWWWIDWLFGPLPPPPPPPPPTRGFTIEWLDLGNGESEMLIVH